MMPSSQTSLFLGSSHVIMWGGSSQYRMSDVLSKYSQVVIVFKAN